MGSGLTLGQRGGEEAHTVLQSEMPQHIHVVQVDGITAATSYTSTPTAGASLGQTIGSPSQGSQFPLNIYSTGTANSNLAPQTVGSTGGSQPHENRQPFLTLSYCSALQGIFPSQN